MIFLGVGGEHHAVAGKVTLAINFGGLTVEHDFLVIDNLHNSLILGIDFMERYKVKLDRGNRLMSILDAYICTLSTNVGYARTVNPITIDPNCETDITVKIARCQNGEEVLIEPIPWLQKMQLQGAKCVVTIQKGKSLVRLMNPTDKSIHLGGNKVIGLATSLNADTVFSLQTDSLDPDVVSTPVNGSEQQNSAHDEITDEELNLDFENSDLNEEQKQILHAFLLQNKDVFTTGLHNLGKTHLLSHHIDTGDSPPVRTPHYKQTPAMRRETEMQIKEMLAHKIIEPSNSAWHSPVVLIRKPNNEWRFAVDYRKLNKVTKPQSFPLPRLSDMLDAIGEANAKFFTTADISKAYWQIPLDEVSKERSAFITYDGIYAWNSMPFGLMNAPATFQSLMSSIFLQINWRYVLCYIDDIVVFSSTFEMHMQQLAEVFQRLREAGLKLSPSKCSFAKRQIKYLGHILSKAGILPDPSKFERFKNLAPPTTPTEVKSVLGLFNFYKKFIKGYNKNCAPLFALLQKEKTLVWTEDCQKSFDLLKTALISAPILAYPDMNRPFTLTCDASRQGIGYILGQVGEDNREHVIAYGGRAVHKAEKNYPISELEFLAVIEEIREYRTYLSSGKFTMYTDHQPLKYIQSVRNPVSRLSRWSMEMQQYQFDVQHRKGVNNQNADALSRLPFPNSPETLNPPTLAPVRCVDLPGETREWLKLRLEFASPKISVVNTTTHSHQQDSNIVLLGTTKREQGSKKGTPKRYHNIGLTGTQTVTQSQTANPTDWKTSIWREGTHQGEQHLRKGINNWEQDQSSKGTQTESPEISHKSQHETLYTIPKGTELREQDLAKGTQPGEQAQNSMAKQSEALTVTQST